MIINATYNRKMNEKGGTSNENIVYMVVTRRLEVN